MSPKESKPSFRPRLFMARGFIRLNDFSAFLNHKISSFLGSLILIISGPEEIKALMYDHYQKRGAVESWGSLYVQTRGLDRQEEHFISHYLKERAKCLVLACGGGREPIALAKLGYQVTGIDASAPLIEKAKQYAESVSLPCTFHVGNILSLSLPNGKYDALFLSQVMYSAIPTKAARIRFLKSLHSFLEREGLLYLEFYTKSLSPKASHTKFLIKKRLAKLVRGYTELEEGDMIEKGGHFFHVFQEEAEFLEEAKCGGFSVKELNFIEGYAVLALNPNPPS